MKLTLTAVGEGVNHEQATAILHALESVIIDKGNIHTFLTAKVDNGVIALSDIDEAGRTRLDWRYARVAGRTELTYVDWLKAQDKASGDDCTCPACRLRSFLTSREPEQKEPATDEEVRAFDAYTKNLTEHETIMTFDEWRATRQSAEGQ